MRRIDSISVVGLGKLGLCITCCFADKGYRVIGVDTDRRRIDSLNRGKNPVQETGLTQLMKECKRKLSGIKD